MLALQADIWGLEVLKDELQALMAGYRAAAHAMAYGRALAMADEICTRIHDQVDLSGAPLRELRKLRVIAKDKSSKGEPYYAPYKAGRGGTRRNKAGNEFSLRTDSERCKPENVTKTLMATGKLSDLTEYIIRIKEDKHGIRALLLPPRGRGPVFNSLYKKYWYGPSFGTNPEMRQAWADDWKRETEQLLGLLREAVARRSQHPPAMQEAS
jgi:hypothetical protein